MARRVIPRTCMALMAAAFTLAGASCYSNDEGQSPPLSSLYFPVGLQVSAGGNALYVVNSNFDLQYNGGTIQSYDLGAIRRDVLRIIDDPRDARVKLVDRSSLTGTDCPSLAQPTNLGQSCSPPVDSAQYVKDAVIVGAFATDLLLSKPPAQLEPATPRTSLDEKLQTGSRRFDRLYSPVRGNASLTWVSVVRDSLDQPAIADPQNPFSPFRLQCGRDAEARCDAAHQAGTNPDERFNTRRITMPGEPFGVALSADGESILVTHQNEQKTSLFSTGQRRTDGDSASADEPLDSPPALQFVLDGVPFGGVGLVAVPHDRDAYWDNPGLFPRNAFLQTSRATPQVSLLRRHPDEFGGVAGTTFRPFLDLEGTFDLTVGPNGTDSRGIAIDTTPRLACKAKVAPVDPAKGRLEADRKRDLQACARKPARVFIANRSPAALLVGEVGGSPGVGEQYNPDQLRIHTSVPLTLGAVNTGPSKVYLAPVVEADGRYGLRVFVVCFDAFTVFVYDPERGELENIIKVAPGPFAMAFDPFSLEDVATHAEVPIDLRNPDRDKVLRRYRFAYLASFTESYLQVLDLDNAHPKSAQTFERIVFTLGQPTRPKGS
ncbi:MAG: hypothetical protein JST00_04505 [Deltaproteobacteria bacterium]|nr:hypothetical protein [Deltaproteobacteria bacterium]